MLSNKSLEIIKTLAGKYHLKLVILFGGLAQGIYDDKSDIDLAILPEDNSFYENECLSKLIYDLMAVEDIERREVDVVPITSENPLLLYQIGKYGEPVYEKDEETYIRFLNWARFTYEDNLRFHRGLDELILEDLKKL
ncbi:MAG: nucleotidyltransferase domain-containing protein [Planctomycetes bacterium]|nr:nucleotidyltransferase domain-containing protein [Planctomycetota bacterium]